MKHILTFSLVILVSLGCDLPQHTHEPLTTIVIPAHYIKDIAVPKGYARTTAIENSFSLYLRNLEIKANDNEVTLYNGKAKGNQSAHYAILNMDVGNKDLQQCADAVMRLRAEYLFKQKKYAQIHFNFTSGDRADWTKYAEGYRAKIQGNKVSWVKTASVDNSYQNFRKYLDLVFSYAGSASLSKELKKTDIKDMQIGDVFIQGGFPGHAVIVVDMAYNKQTGKKLFMLAQSYMPAQEIHILKNPDNEQFSPWYEADFEGRLNTPEWTFNHTDLKRFAEY